MTNICHYEMCIRGNKKVAQKLLIDVIMKITYSTTVQDNCANTDTCYLIGSCRNSAYSTFVECEKFQNIIKYYNLDVEIRCSESEGGFIEHYFWLDGDKISHYGIDIDWYFDIM